MHTITKQGLVPWKLMPRDSLDGFEPETTLRQFITSLDITVTPSATNASAEAPKFSNSTKSSGHGINLDGSTADHAYNLTIGTDGKAAIAARSTDGVINALASFTQLFYKHSNDRVDGGYTKMAPVSISDEPKFIYRGLNLDVARSWYELDDIKRAIDGMAQTKLNVLHLHITDSQSWPIEIPALPELAKKGAYQEWATYSTRDIEKLHKYALRRGVTINMEMDMPGHTTAIAYAYPQLIAAAFAKPWYSYCAEPPCGTLQLNNPEVDKFIDTLFKDLLPRISPYTSMFHSGGDEVNANAYTLDPTTNSSDKAVIGKGIQKLKDRIHAHVREAGLTPMVWEEMAIDWDLDLGKDVVVGAWHTGYTAKAVEKGYRVIAGDSNYWYLDCGRGAWINYDNTYLDRFPFNDYCSPVKNWRAAYAYDPLEGVPKDKQHLVLGAEAHLWSEQTDGISLDDMLWPRASAAAEVMWSGRYEKNGEPRSQLTAVHRLSEHRERLVNQNFQARPVHMPFCTQLDPSECS